MEGGQVDAQLFIGEGLGVTGVGIIIIIMIIELLVQFWFAQKVKTSMGPDDRWRTKNNSKNLSLEPLTQGLNNNNKHSHDRLRLLKSKLFGPITNCIYLN